MPFCHKRQNAWNIMAGLLSMILVFVIVSGMAWAAQITLAWDPNTEPDIAGYKLYIGYSPNLSKDNYSFFKIVVGNQTQTSYTVTDGITYYFTLTAYNEKGYESAISNIVRYPALELNFRTFLPIIRK
jgi:hypothetical protein